MKITEELRFIELIGDYTVELRIDTFPYEYIYRNMKGEWLIYQDQKRGYTWISYDRIWSVFYTEYNMKYEEVKSLMNILLLKHLKIEETIPEFSILTPSI